TTYVGYEPTQTQLDVAADVNVLIALNPASIFTDAVVVSATRATDKTATTFDAGTGIGYTGIRIRGSDGTRINVTINGIPYNDSESLGTFWVDVPDIATSTNSIQIQRGVG